MCAAPATVSKRWIDLIKSINLTSRLISSLCKFAWEDEAVPLVSPDTGQNQEKVAIIGYFRCIRLAGTQAGYSFYSINFMYSLAGKGLSCDIITNLRLFHSAWTLVGAMVSC